MCMYTQLVLGELVHGPKGSNATNCQTRDTAGRLLGETICLSTLTSVANYLLNDALRLDNDLSALATMCSSWSVSKLQNPL